MRVRFFLAAIVLSVLSGSATAQQRTVRVETPPTDFDNAHHTVVGIITTDDAASPCYGVRVSNRPTGSWTLVIEIPAGFVSDVTGVVYRPDGSLAGITESHSGAGSIKAAVEEACGLVS